LLVLALFGAIACIMSDGTVGTPRRVWRGCLAGPTLGTAR
jgi:hypothetical protein